MSVLGLRGKMILLIASYVGRDWEDHIPYKVSMYM